MIKRYIAYIDEAGDEGFGKLKSSEPTGQSRWLILGAAVVSEEIDEELPTYRDEILSAFPKKKARDLHFRNLNHNQKVSAAKYLSAKRIGFCAIASNKVTIIGHPKEAIFKAKGHLYNYLVRFALERITATCARAAQKVGQKAKLKLVFSRRGGTDYQSMQNYLALMRDGKEVFQSVRSINWDVLDLEDLRVENHSKWAGLQIADVMTSATFLALEPNTYGHYEHRYALELSQRYIRDRGSPLNCGLTLIPPAHKNPLCPEQKKFVVEIQKKR